MGKIQRADAKVNKALVKKTAISLFEQTGSMPTITAVSKHTGIGRQTVAKYWGDMVEDFSKMVAPYRILTPKVIEANYKAATDLENGSAADRKLWYQVVEGRLGAEDTNSGSDIQINVITSSQNTNIQVNQGE